MVVYKHTQIFRSALPLPPRAHHPVLNSNWYRKIVPLTLDHKQSNNITTY